MQRPTHPATGMARRRIRLLQIGLAYANGIVLHTATSGALTGLEELRLVVEERGAIVALGASRMNIAYLSGIAPARLVEHCLDAVRAVDWSLPWDALAASFPPMPAPARMLLEMVAADGAARARGVSLTEYLRGAPGADAYSLPTNQTLFRSGMAELLHRAGGYVARGFLDLKLRVGFGPFADDLARLRELRRVFGNRIALSVDANGCWNLADAPGYLAALAPFGLRYVEQPIAPGDWAAMAALSRDAPMPLMLDESLADMESVAHLAETRAATLGHLKLAKLGGLDRLMQAGRLLRAAGIPFMVGQMNEGSVSTLAAAHAARALGAELNELYGADGLAADPAGLLQYEAGTLSLPPGPGLGLVRHATDHPILWEATA